MRNMKSFLFCILTIVFILLSGCVDNNDSSEFKLIIDSNHSFDMYDLTQKKIKSQVISLKNSEAGFTNSSDTFTYTYPNRSDLMSISRIPVILESHSTFDITAKDSTFKKITFYNPFSPSKELVSFSCVAVGTTTTGYITIYDVSSKKKFYFINIPYSYSNISANTSNFNSNIIEKSLANSETTSGETSIESTNNPAPPSSIPITPSIINNISIQNSNQKEQ